MNVRYPPTHPGRSSRETLPTTPMMLASISCYLCYDSIGRAPWHPVKILCSGSFLHQVCFGRWGFYASYYTFWTCFCEIKHHGNEFSASYWPFSNAFFSFLCNFLLLLPYWSSAPRLVILMDTSLKIIQTKYTYPWTCRQILNIHMHNTMCFSFPDRSTP